MQELADVRVGEKTGPVVDRVQFEPLGAELAKDEPVFAEIADERTGGSEAKNMNFALFSLFSEFFAQVLSAFFNQKTNF